MSFLRGLLGRADAWIMSRTARVILAYTPEAEGIARSIKSPKYSFFMLTSEGDVPPQIKYFKCVDRDAESFTVHVKFEFSSSEGFSGVSDETRAVGMSAIYRVNSFSPTYSLEDLRQIAWSRGFKY